MAENNTRVIFGADTHKKSHTIAIITETGLELGAKRFPANAKGYRQAWEWACAFGTVLRCGVESTGSYGAGLCSFLKGVGAEVYDVYAPDKKRRRLEGKDDIKDAYQAAQAALSYTRCAQAKDKDEAIEAAINLENAHQLAVRQRTACINALKAAIIKLPDSMRQNLEGKTDADLIKTCAAFRISAAQTDLFSGTKVALRHYAKQIQSLSKEINALDKEIKRYAEALVPNTVGLKGIGHHGSITLLKAAGANIDRLKDDASFSMLCATSPIPASTGDKHHFRLNPGGNRKANCAIHIMAITRIRLFEKTRAFIDKKISEGKTKKDAIRCLKRYLSREVYGSLRADLAMLGVMV